MKIKLSETREIEVTPRLLAQAFWEMDNDAQAEFFDHLWNVSEGKLKDQMENVACFTDGLSLNALRAMMEIGKNATERDGKL